MHPLLCRCKVGRIARLLGNQNGRNAVYLLLSARYHDLNDGKQEPGVCIVKLGLWYSYTF